MKSSCVKIVAGRCLPAVSLQKDPFAVFKEAGARSMLGLGNDEMIQERSRVMTQFMEALKVGQHLV